jgi:predicted O-methyltransferase YrrM
MRDEPMTAEAVAAWARARRAEADPFASVYAASDRHREEHGCEVYPTSQGPLLGLLARVAGARRVLEIGCGLGYSALWLAHGAGPEARVETVERDTTHAELARRNFEEAGASGRIDVRVGRALDLLPAREGHDDLIFVDGDVGEYPASLPHFVRLLRPGGLLVSSNLFLGRYDASYPALGEGAEYRRLLLADERLQTVFLDDGLALSVRTDG